MKKNEQDIKKTLAQLHIEGAQAEQMAEEIAAGDELLGRYAEVEVDPAVLGRVEKVVRAELGGGGSRSKWMRWVVRAAAVVLVGAGLGAWVAYENLQKERMSSPFDSEINMWELSLQEENEAAEQIDDLQLTELALWLDELEAETTDDIMGKEQNHGHLV